MTELVVAPVVAFAITSLVLLILLSPIVRHRLLDRPNARSLHTVPVPRTGGIAVMAGVLVTLANTGAPLLLWAGALVLAVLSLIDDWRTLPSSLRLVVHLLVTLLFARLCLGGYGSVAVVFAALGIAWMANLYNFMDGADGLAGGMTVVGFSTFALAAAIAGDFVMASLCLTVGLAGLAFLLRNFPPASIFMGDAGSLPLGFMAGAIGVGGWYDGLWPLWFPWVVFAPFTVDASVTLLRRALRRERIWQAHRSHYYQRLILSGWSHRRTALAEFGLMVGTAGLALACLGRPGLVQVVLLGAGAVVYACLMFMVDKRAPRNAEPR